MLLGLIVLVLYLVIVCFIWLLFRLVMNSLVLWLCSSLISFMLIWFKFCMVMLVLLIFLWFSLCCMVVIRVCSVL